MKKVRSNSGSKNGSRKVKIPKSRLDGFFADPSLADHSICLILLVAAWRRGVEVSSAAVFSLCFRWSSCRNSIQDSRKWADSRFNEISRRVLRNGTYCWLGRSYIKFLWISRLPPHPLACEEAFSGHTSSGFIEPYPAWSCIFPCRSAYRSATIVRIGGCKRPCRFAWEGVDQHLHGRWIGCPFGWSTPGNGWQRPPCWIRRFISSGVCISNRIFPLLKVS
jgi:hypothetical protein